MGQIKYLPGYRGSNLSYRVKGNELRYNESLLKRTFGHAESLFSCETLQFADYSQGVFIYFDPEERKERRRTVFPKDGEKAFDPGVRLGTIGFFEPSA